MIDTTSGGGIEEGELGEVEDDGSASAQVCAICVRVASCPTIGFCLICKYQLSNVKLANAPHMEYAFAHVVWP